MSLKSQVKTAEKNKFDNEVLFQKLGGKWYVFSEVNDDFVYSPLPDGIDPRSTKLELFNIIEEHINKIADYYKESA